MIGPVVTFGLCFLLAEPRDFNTPAAPQDFVADEGNDQLEDVLNELRTQRSVPLTVNQAVAIALKNNFAIRDAAVQRIADRFDVWVAQDRFNPHVSIGGSAGKTLTRGADTMLGSAGATVGVTPHAEVILPFGALISADLSQSIDAQPIDGLAPWRGALILGVAAPLIKGRGKAVNLAPLRIATWNNGISKLQYRATMLAQISRVIFAYRDFTQASLLLEIAEKAVARAKEVWEYNQQLVAAGRVARADLIQVESEIALREANLANAAADYVRYQIALLQLIALIPDAPVAPVRERVGSDLSNNLAQAQSLALGNRPEYASDLLRREVASQNVVLARNNRQWDLSLFAQYQRGGNSARPNRILSQVVSGDTQAVSVGLTLQVPIIESVLDGDVVRAEVDLSQADLAVRLRRQTIVLETEAAVRALRLRRGIFGLSTRARRLANENLENEKEKLAAGRSSTFVALRFVTDLVNAEVAEIKAQVAFLNAITTVHTVTGVLLDTWGVQGTFAD